MTVADTYSANEAFEFCEQLAKAHYENFPVASFFLPKDKRPFVWSIYAFARAADDFADEGVATPERRIEMLNSWGVYLDECYQGKASHPIFIALSETVGRCNIPKHLLCDLLTAFRMDVMQKRFGTFNELIHYCRHSANPIGQLVLRIFDNLTERTAGLSNSICTALQLANFWQDVSVDWKKGRMYIPLEDVKRFGYTEHDLDASIIDERFRNLLAFEVDRTKDLFAAGKPLLEETTKDLRFELNLTWRGGMKILEKIERLNYDVLHKRPRVSFGDKLSILGTSLLHLR